LRGLKIKTVGYPYIRIVVIRQTHIEQVSFGFRSCAWNSEVSEQKAPTMMNMLIVVMHKIILSIIFGPIVDVFLVVLTYLW
jgi:hypothetical protein